MTTPTNSTGLETGRWPGRSGLQPNQVSQLLVTEVTTGGQRLVLESDRLIESPNWTPDGEWFIVNGHGRLYRVRADGTGDLEHIPVTGVRGVNNDHVLSPDGRRIYFSADGHLYRVPIEGGEARRVSNLHPEEQHYSYWLHGVSPDELELAYVSVEPEGDRPRARRNLATIPAAGGPDRQLTTGVNDYDGPEYSPDGEWIYYNSEEVSSRPGHAQIFRMRRDGTGREQLTFDERVNWFPHLTPDGRAFAYISYAPGTITHPADVDVELRMLPAAGGTPRVIVELFGGQGTLNTNSWAQDSTQFAFVAYPSVVAAPRADDVLGRLLSDEEAELEHFGHDEAWQLGLWLRDRLVADGVVGAVAVYVGEQRAFVGSVAESSADLDGWLDRKARTVRIWGHSSFWVKHRFAPGPEDFQRFLSDPRGIAAAGGGFPIRVRGSIVGVVACSGWTEEGEHALGVEAVRWLGARQR
ncbi:MAG: hypothetical protein HIU86_14635 [Acidobacteria bacterium]|nr:hypothetical protein [Acidobacteriota bacterium]